MTANDRRQQAERDSSRHDQLVVAVFVGEGGRRLGIDIGAGRPPIKHLIGERVPVDDRRLADPDVPLEEIVSLAHGGVA